MRIKLWEAYLAVFKISPFLGGTNVNKWGYDKNLDFAILYSSDLMQNGWIAKIITHVKQGISCIYFSLNTLLHNFIHSILLNIYIWL